MTIKGNKVSPFVKWVGGKRDVINKHLHKYFPESFNNYFEPFVGGGAVLFYLMPNNCYINDWNYELITTYCVIKNDVKSLIKKLDKYHQLHSKEFFMDLRKQNPKNKLDIATRFIYLNKAGFNGMYRVNSKNEFNVPFGKKTKEKLNLYNEKNLVNLSNYFNEANIEFFNSDFSKILEFAKKDDFVFCDPPYDYEPNTNGFVEYTKQGFSQKEQIRLANELKKLDKKNVKWMLTNHNTRLIQELYKDFNIVPITTNRNINSKGQNRKNYGNEVVIMNYDYNLSTYFSTLEKTNIELKDIVDINKIIKDIDQVEMNLYSLDYIISNSKEEIIEKIKKLYIQNKDVFSVLPLLIAYDAKKEIKLNIETIKLNELIKTLDGVILFFEQTGLIELILKQKVKHFVDYLTGVKVGIDTNARKNRFGTKNENDIQQIIDKEFEKYKYIKIEYQKQIDEFKNIKSISNKRFDVVITNIKTNKSVLIESSYYNTQGSKISETSRSYTEVFNEIKEYKDKYKFIWVLDGYGVNSIKNELSEKLKFQYIFNKKSFVNEIKSILNLK